MTAEEIEQCGWEDGYYLQPSQPPAFYRQAYMYGYWHGCQVRAEEQQRLSVLEAQWAKEDATA